MYFECLYFVCVYFVCVYFVCVYFVNVYFVCIYVFVFLLNEINQSNDCLKGTALEWNEGF